MASVFVAGASRRTGFELVRRLRQDGNRVTAMFRTASEQPRIEALGAQVVLADAFEAASVERALQTGGPWDAVFCTIGGRPGDSPRIDYIGVKHIVDAAKAANIERFFLVTAIGCGDTFETLEPRAQVFLRDALLAKNQAEAYLRVSELSYTIIRPGHLTDDPATGSGVLTTDARASGSISRAEVAALLVKAWQSPHTKRVVLSAVDRAKLAPSRTISEVTL